MPSSNKATATIFTRPPCIWGWWHWCTHDCVNLPNMQRKFVKLPNIGEFYYAKLTQIGLKVYYNPNTTPTSPAMAQQPPHCNIHRWAVTILLGCILVIVFGLTIMTAQQKLDWYSLISNSGINNTDSQVCLYCDHFRPVCKGKLQFLRIKVVCTKNPYLFR